MRQLQATDPDVEIAWRAYELRPEPVPTLDPKGDYLQRVWHSSVYPMAERFGVTMKLPPVQPRSRLAHEAAHWARARGSFDAYNEAVFRAFFERGENIGEIDVLVALARETGLDQDALRHALTARELEASVLEDESDARTLGISGVPAFVANRTAALSGVQPVASLKMLVDHIR